METFKLIAKIKYKGQRFCILINRACQKYFIKELEDGSISYPTVEEFVELSDSLNNIDRKMYFLGFGEKYRFDPKVIKDNFMRKMFHPLTIQSRTIHQK